MKKNLVKLLLGSILVFAFATSAFADCFSECWAAYSQCVHNGGKNCAQQRQVCLDGCPVSAAQSKTGLAASAFQATLAKVPPFKAKPASPASQSSVVPAHAAIFTLYTDLQE